MRCTVRQSRTSSAQRGASKADDVVGHCRGVGTVLRADVETGAAVRRQLALGRKDAAGVHDGNTRRARADGLGIRSIVADDCNVSHEPIFVAVEVALAGVADLAAVWRRKGAEEEEGGGGEGEGWAGGRMGAMAA